MRRVRKRRPEGPRSVTEKNRQGIVVEVREDEINLLVAVEIGYVDRGRRVPERVVGRRREGTVTNSQQDRHAERVRASQVEVAVPIEVGGRIDIGAYAVRYDVGGERDPSGRESKTDIDPAGYDQIDSSEMARSERPSWLKSPAVIAVGSKAPEYVGTLSRPEEFPRTTARVCVFVEFCLATTKSVHPSELTSPFANAEPSIGDVTGAWKVPLPFPVRSVTPDQRAARSSLPSWL